LTTLADTQAYATTPGGWLVVMAVMLPVLGPLVILFGGARHAERIAMTIIAAGALATAAIVYRLAQSGDALAYVVGGWAPPLGLVLRVDGVAGALLAVSATVVVATGWYARCQFRTVPPADKGRTPVVFWSLLLSVWGALNAVASGQDLFNLYVALELLTFAAVPLVCLDGRGETLAAALRYLMFALAGSLLYLLGTALLYGAYGTLDIRLLSKVIAPGPASSAALALMTAGLLAKAALFPLHLWLPPAHAGAPAAASAVLSALVVKAPFFLLLRLWFDVAPQAGGFAFELLSALGLISILFCSVMALQQARLKLLIAYSTLAQIGYLFLIFVLARGTDTIPPWATMGWTAGILQLASHAFAKAAMFMAAGIIAEAYGHDRIADLSGFGRALPVSALAFALGGLSLMGLPPSGGFVAKWLMVSAAVTQGRWIVAGVILVGSLLAAGYVFKVIGQALAKQEIAPTLRLKIPRYWEAGALALALAAVALGLVPMQPSGFLQIGRPGLSAVKP
jgi:multicomponent Na+:H+ antiporter subunit D